MYFFHENIPSDTGWLLLEIDRSTVALPPQEEILAAFGKRVGNQNGQGRPLVFYRLT